MSIHEDVHENIKPEYNQTIREINQDEITELTRKTTQLIQMKNETDPSKEHLNNAMSISMALLGVFTTLTQTYEIPIVILFILYYLNDMRKTTKDFIVHHILSISVCITGLYLKIYNLPIDQFRQMVLYMELSAPLYALSLYIHHPFTDGLFTGWFIYCRIYKQYCLLNDPATYNEIGIGCIPYCFLFGLNLYWIFRGLKRLFKPFKDPVYKLYCHKIIPFVRPLNLSLILSVDPRQAGYAQD